MTGAELAERCNTDPRTAALHYASLGWPVVPTAGIISGHCGCRAGANCDQHVGKHPLCRGGTAGASIDPRTIRQWYEAWPWAGVGIITGHRSGLLVVDVDPKHGGRESMARLAAEGIDLSATLTSHTGGGGEHHLWLGPPEPKRWPSTIGAIPGLGDLPGIDLRGNGVMIVAAPSAHESGQRYQWDPTSPAAQPLPSAVVDVLPDSGPGRTHRPTASAPATDRHGVTAYAAAALRGEVNNVLRARPPSSERARDGERDKTLNLAALSLGNLIGGGQLPRRLVEDELLGAARQVGLGDAEARRTIRSGIEAGITRPCFPGDRRGRGEPIGAPTRPTQGRPTPRR
jgi:hypothetical protein